MKNNFKKNLFTLFVITFFVFIPVFQSYADGYTCDPSLGQVCNPLPNINSLEGLIKTILEGVVKIGIPIIALAIVYSGFLFVSARGKPESLKKAKDALIYTLIGAAILLGSWAIAQLISDTVLQL